MESLLYLLFFFEIYHILYYVYIYIEQIFFSIIEFYCSKKNIVFIFEFVYSIYFNVQLLFYFILYMSYFIVCAKCKHIDLCNFVIFHVP